MKKRLLISSISIILIAAVCGIGYVSLTSHLSEAFKSSEPKTYALGLAKSNTEVINKIGNEIFIDTLETDKTQKGQFKLELDFNGFSFGQDAIDLILPVKGNKGKASLYVVAEKKNKHWIYKTVKIEIDKSGTVINLIEESNK
jgi:hypothetical protein